MQTPILRSSAISLTVATGLALTVMSATAVAQSQGQMSKRQWPSQSLPEAPVTARICSCLYAGENIPIGQTVCMKFRGARVLAKCDTVVNSPSWTISKTPCPQA